MLLQVMIIDPFCFWGCYLDRRVILFVKTTNPFFKETVCWYCRIIFSICCKLQCWSTNSGFKHNNGNSCPSNFVVSHATVLLHSQCHLGSYHHNCCDRANRLWGCFSIVESRQTWFRGLHMFLFRCFVHLSSPWSCHRGKLPFSKTLFIKLLVHSHQLNYKFLISKDWETLIHYYFVFVVQFG